MSYYPTSPLGAIDARVGEGGSGAGGGSGTVPRRRVPAVITGALPLIVPRLPPGFEPRPGPGPALPTRPRDGWRPPGFEPRPAPAPLPTQTVSQARPAGIAPKPAGGGGGGSGKGSFVIDPIDLEVAPTPAAPSSAATSRLPLFLLIGAGAFVGYKLLRRRK